MVTIRKIKVKDWRLVKSLRLAALADAPYAFAETLDEAQKMPDSEWKQRALQNAEGKDSTCALAFDGDVPVGMAVGLLDENDESIAYLAALWVAPHHRGKGTAEVLVEVVASWAAKVGAHSLVAGVMKGNDRAAAFFRKVGFENAQRPRSWSEFICSCELVIEKCLKEKKANQQVEQG